MMTSSNGNIFCVTALLCGEFTGDRWIPRTKASYAELWCFFELHLNQQLSKKWRRQWFETPSRSLRRRCKDVICLFDPSFPAFRIFDIYVSIWWLYPWQQVSTGLCWGHTLRFPKAVWTSNYQLLLLLVTKFRDLLIATKINEICTGG